MAMTKFTGWQYLLIDVANNFGLDKLLFEERISWVESNMNQLELLADNADCKPLYIKAVMAVRKALRHEPTGHLVGMDACCSGIQVMSALTGCVDGAMNTGFINPNVRADAYTLCTVFMNEELTGSVTLSGGLVVSRKDAKDALMTSFYGSKAKPKEIFGEDTPELNAFYVAAQRVAPGAWELLQDLLASWQPFALKHSWKLPDGFDAVVKVMKKEEARIEVDELDHSTFTYEFYVNEGSKNGLSLVANVVHSVDAYILRGVHRRCNYDHGMVERALDCIASALHDGARNGVKPTQPLDTGTKLAYYVEQFTRSGMADVVILPFITAANVNQLSTIHLEKLRDIILTMLVHSPFPVVTVHDEFKCGANHMNHLRQHYINIFAELAESNLLSDLLSQIHGTPCTFKKLSNDLGSKIRGSNYALS
jgi:hypothetical protein